MLHLIRKILFQFFAFYPNLVFIEQLHLSKHIAMSSRKLRAIVSRSRQAVGKKTQNIRPEQAKKLQESTSEDEREKATCLDRIVVEGTYNLQHLKETNVLWKATSDYVVWGNHLISESCNPWSVPLLLSRRTNIQHLSNQLLQANRMLQKAVIPKGEDNYTFSIILLKTIKQIYENDLATFWRPTAKFNDKQTEKNSAAKQCSVRGVPPKTLQQNDTHQKKAHSGSMTYTGLL